MDSRSSTLFLTAFLVLLTGLSNSVSANRTIIYRDDFNLSIPADKSQNRGLMNDATIEIVDHYVICDLDIIVDITHTSVFDLQIRLRSPSGTKIFLNKYNYRKDFLKGGDYIQTIFDDESQIPIELGRPPFTGRFKPKGGNFLKAFDGEDIYGTWRLQINDQFYYDTGTLNSFGLAVTVPEPATITFLTLGTISLRRWMKPRYR